MKGEHLYRFLKVDNEVILKLNGESNGRRALFVYSYLMHIEGGARAIPTDISKLLEAIGLSMSTSSKKSVVNSMGLLVDLGLVSVYKDTGLIEGVNLEDMVARPRDTIWVKVSPSIAEYDFTLIPKPHMDKIIFSQNNEKSDSMFAVLSYICLKTERREGTLPVMWASRNKMAKDIHMTERTIERILDCLVLIKSVYFERVSLSGNRSNYIYGLYQDKSGVASAARTAKENNVVDKRIKYAVMTNNVIDLDDGEFVIDVRLSDFFDRHGVECNNGVADETNRFYRKHGQAKLLDTLGEYNSEILNADNKNGAYRGVLRRNY